VEGAEREWRQSAKWMEPLTVTESVEAQKQRWPRPATASREDQCAVPKARSRTTPNAKHLRGRRRGPGHHRNRRKRFKQRCEPREQGASEVVARPDQSTQAIAFTLPRPDAPLVGSRPMSASSNVQNLAVCKATENADRLIKRATHRASPPRHLSES